jgi:tRNA pseudouridine38-40 synthase
MTQTRTIRATVEYDGTGFRGFQRQASTRTVQGALEAAISSSVSASVGIEAAGRTDSGVHAQGQVICFSVSSDLPDDVLQRAINAHLPADVALRQLSTTKEGFRPRGDAVSRVYRYRIDQGETRPVLDRDRAWYVSQPLDIDRMRLAAEEFVGTHDFNAYTSGRQVNTWRSVHDFAVWRVGGSVHLQVEANAFLYRMVRRMVADLVRVGRGVMEISDIKDALKLGLRLKVQDCAPANGLTLLHVQYPDRDSRYNVPHLVGDELHSLQGRK